MSVLTVRTWPGQKHNSLGSTCKVARGVTVEGTWGPSGLPAEKVK